MSSLARRLSALGVDDRTVWDASQTSGPAHADGARELGFSLCWRFGPPGQTARITWRVRVSEDGAGRTMLSVAVHARASDDEATKRLVTGWPIVETIALEHAKGMRRAMDEYAADSCEAEHPIRRVREAA
jgi:hypothetical protein